MHFTGEFPFHIFYSLLISLHQDCLCDDSRWDYLLVSFQIILFDVCPLLWNNLIYVIRLNGLCSQVTCFIVVSSVELIIL